jgi:protein-disulfide isomerase
VKISCVAVLCLVALSLLPSRIDAQTAAKTQTAPAVAQTTQLQKTVEAYLRNLYAFGPDVNLVVSLPKDSEVPGLLESTVDLKIGENTEKAKFYVSKDGKYLIRGEVSELSKDPLAQNRALLDIKDAPSFGNPNATVTLVEFSDFECPVCRSLHDVVRGLLSSYPQARIVFKDYPIEALHPWARTAALAGRCAYNQKPEAFWKMYDLIYDNQDIISPENAWTKMADFAAQTGLDADTFRGCMSSPEAGAAVNASRENGQKLDVNSTPTIFVNGRRLVGADPHMLEQYVQYELAKHQEGNTAQQKK